MADKEKSPNTKRMEELGKYPQLVPLTEAQKEAFSYLWKAMPDYERRRKLVGSIPDLYNNRMRYRDACLLPESEDWDTFNRITRDPETRF